jgi:hypothetical protein
MVGMPPTNKPAHWNVVQRHWTRRGDASRPSYPAGNLQVKVFDYGSVLIAEGVRDAR